MVRKRKWRWLRWVRRILLVVATPFLIVLALLLLPIVLPFAALAHARADKRKRALVERWPCGWCVAPLGAAALARADALFAAHIDKVFAPDEMYRIVRDLHACCPRCDAGHHYDEAANRFELLDVREFARRYGDLPSGTVESATATLAWPWLAPRGPLHTVALTRDSVCLADDIDAPHAGSVEVPGEADVAAIAEALLRSPWLAHVGSDTTWTFVACPATLVFGLRAGIPFVIRAGAEAIRSDSVATLHVRYEAQRDPDEVRRGLPGVDES